MKQKPYLSRYEFNLQGTQSKIHGTMVTESTEPSDDDEYHLDSTTHTFTTESSDSDEYIAGSTSRKRGPMMDEDEYYGFGTMVTRASEDSDTDFFLINMDN